MKPGSPQPGLTRNASDLIVAVRERAVDGEANAAVIKAIAAWLNLPPARIKLEHGTRTRTKRFIISDLDEAAYWTAFRRL